jgi:S-adenosylmethionine:diacylglycerol 3-amino-3-carboxypropyl transferase
MSKVARLIDELELEGVGEELEEYWLGEREEQYSLRTLADWFNKRVLAAALEAQDQSYVEGELENTYELLTDDVGGATRAEVEARLEQQGIDIERLESSFVSHQSIHTYLRKYREVSKPEPDDSDESRIENTREAIQRLVNRTNAVVRNNLESLRNTGRITLGKFTIIVDVQVFCQDCETQSSVDELLSNGGCACESSTQPAPSE